jgi:atypical dual specificity phosphatase
MLCAFQFDYARSGQTVRWLDLQSLREQGIEAIITLTEHALTTQSEITPQLLDEMELTCLHTPIVDQYPPDLATMQRIVKFIHRMRGLGKPVFVHCHAGVGRTGTALHAYYLTTGLSLEAAKAQVKARKLTCQFLMLSETQKAFLETLSDRQSPADR